jgi:hypothetical protein
VEQLELKTDAIKTSGAQLRQTSAACRRPRWQLQPATQVNFPYATHFPPALNRTNALAFDLRSTPTHLISGIIHTATQRTRRRRKSN